MPASPTPTYILPVILAGGGGTRLWPLSRGHYPKQFLALGGDDSLLQQTLTRLRGIQDTGAAAPIVVCNEEHRFLVAEQARLCGAELTTIMLEPVGRNTAPALSAAAAIATREGADPLLLMMPSDHLIADRAAFQRAVLAGAELAAKALDDTVLRAPMAGVVAQRLAQPGERVAIDTRILEIVDLSRLELEASISPADSLRVKAGQVARLTIEGATAPLAAKVVRVNPSALSGSRAVLAYLSVQPNPGLRQGLFAQGTLATGTVSVLAAPLNAVRTDKPLPYVQLIQDGAVLHQTVELGARGESDGQSLVGLKGVSENALLLSGTVGSLRAGTRVKLPQGQ